MSRFFKHFLFLILCIFITQYINAKEAKYPVSDIPQNLKDNAKCVIRYYEDEFEINAVNSATENVKIVMTILNKNGLDNSIFREDYNKFSKISKINVTIYDAYGFKGKTIKNDDIKDYSGISGFSTYEDCRYKFIDPEEREIPFTIEYEFQRDYKGLLNYPEWLVFPDYNISVQNSTYRIKCPGNLSFRYFQQNLDIKPDISSVDGKNIYLWKVENLPAIRPELYCLPQLEYLPIVFSAPNDFEIGGTIGNTSSWQSFGKWANSLTQSSNNLPEITKGKMIELVKNEPDDYHKVEKIYRYLQDNTRFVSIQGGIRDWQPVDAGTVDRLKYGDCKALTNYMKSLLDAVGIRSFYTLAFAGENGLRINKDFPANWFNHVFLCVPVRNDTLWLECTSQVTPCGYIGTFTDDRDVLVTQEDGGHIVHTPQYSVYENVQVNTAKVKLNLESQNSVTISNSYKGCYYDDMMSFVVSDEKDRKELLYRMIEIPSFDISEFHYSLRNERLPSINLNINLNLNNYATHLGNNLLFNPNLLNHITGIPKKTDERLSDIFIRRSSMEIDSISYSLPLNFEAGTLPAPKVITSKFGEYRNELKNNGTEVIYIRKLIMNKGTYPKNLYAELTDFFDKISIADGSKISIKKKN